VASDALTNNLQFSADGRYLVFLNTENNCYVYDRVTQKSEQIAPGYNNSFASISADGRYVALHSWDLNGFNIFVYDRINHTSELASYAPDGTHANNNSTFPSISGDGRYVVYRVEHLSNTPPDDTPDGTYVYDRNTHTTIRVGDGRLGVISQDVSTLF